MGVLPTQHKRKATRILMMAQLLLLLAAASSAANVKQLPPKINHWTTTEEAATTEPWPKDCYEVCRDSTDAEYIPDFCCSRHYCACENGLGLGRNCPEGEGFCLWDFHCSEGGCNSETCCEDFTTAEPATTEPDTTGPYTTEPASTEPDTTGPDTTGPDTTEPATTEPATTEPATTEPDTTGPDTTEPATTEPVTTTTSDAACPLGWIDDGKLGCFLFAPQMAGLSWIEALEYCEEQDGFLAEPKTKEQLNFLTSLAYLEEAATGVQGWWVGLADLGHEGEWVWQVDREDADITTWDSGCPDMSEHNSRDCAALVSITAKGDDEEKQSAARYRDLPCMLPVEEVQVAPICQRGGLNTGTTTAS